MTAYKSNNKSYHIQSNSCKRDFKYSGTSVYVYVSREITQYSYCYLHILEVIQCELIKFNDNAMMVKFFMKIWFCDYFWFLSKSDLDSSFSNSIDICSLLYLAYAIMRDNVINYCIIHYFYCF